MQHCKVLLLFFSRETGEISFVDLNKFAIYLIRWILGGTMPTKANNIDHGDDRLRNDNVDGKEDEGSGWLRKSPSSSFLFGDESMNSTSTSDALSLAGTLMQSMKYYFNDKLSDTESMPLTPTIEREASEFRQPNTYLQMLDKYSNEIKEKADERAKADWLEYVDRNSLENSA
jgi:hypothetical protein